MSLIPEDKLKQIVLNYTVAEIEVAAEIFGILSNHIPAICTIKDIEIIYDDLLDLKGN